MTPTIDPPTNPGPEGSFVNDIALDPPAREHRPAYRPEELDKGAQRDGLGVVWALILVVVAVGAVALGLKQLFG